VLVPGAGAAAPTTPRPDYPEDGVVSGQGQDRLSSAPAYLAGQPLVEHEAAATVTDARQVSPCWDASRGVMPSTRVKEHQPRDVTIHLRANQWQRALIDQVETLGKNRSDFILEAPCREANTVLLDRRLFLLDEKAYKLYCGA
jgi:uncharacterized protein (DUF1778 family)